VVFGFFSAIKSSLDQAEKMRGFFSCLFVYLGLLALICAVLVPQTSAADPDPPTEEPSAESEPKPEPGKHADDGENGSAHLNPNQRHLLMTTMLILRRNLAIMVPM
jgi:hypothetical protein